MWIALKNLNEYNKYSIKSAERHFGAPKFSWKATEALENWLDYLRQLNIVSMMLRIILALLMGGLIGMERERKRRPAGFRTYMLVALGAALTVILSQYLDYMIDNPWAEISAP